MFDTIHVEQAPAYPQHIHNAPTTDQVRFLRELEAQARESVIAGMDLPGNIMGKVVTFRDHEQDRHVVVFDLNGKRHTVRIEKSDLRHAHLTARAAYERLSEIVAGRILAELLK